jgi:hypothetical protein
MSETDLMHQILRHIGHQPDVLVMRNNVAQVLRLALLKELCPSCLAASKRHRMVCGAGVGSPDLIGSVAGKSLYLEVKQSKGVISADQKLWHAAAEARGTHVYIVRSVGDAKDAVEEVRGK